MSDRPDLDWLESVEAEYTPSLVGILLVVVAFACLAFGGVLLYSMLFGLGATRPGFDPNELALCAALFAVGVLTVWALRTPFFDSSWKTDADGVRSAGILRRKRIAWADVEDAETRWVNVFLGRRHVVRGGRQAIHVPDSDPALSASVWQHLRRSDRHAKVALPPAALALWDLPREPGPPEISWTNPHPPTPVWIAAKVVVALGIGIPLLVWLDSTGQGALALLTAVATGSLVARSLSSLFRARSFSATAEGLEAQTPVGRVRCRWDDVRTASVGPSEVWLGYSRWSSLSVPWSEDDELSRRLALTIIQRLRTRARPVHLRIPPALLAPGEGSTDG